MDTLRFFHFVITSSQGGWLCIAASLPDGTGWRQYWFGWPDDDEAAVALVEGLKAEGLNVYFSCHLFREKDTHKEFAIESRTLFVDLDAADTALLPLRQSVLLKSSDERHQAYWLLNEWLPIEDFEQLSRRLTYGIKDADHSGWPIGHMMRVPNTDNFKYVPKQRVRVISFNKDTYDAVDFGVFPSLGVSAPNAITVDDEWIERALLVPAGHNTVHTFWDECKGKLSKGTDIHFYTEAPDRSTALWRLTLECFRAGLTREQTYLIAYHSKNNKFRFLRYGGKQELAKDVMRAEREVFSGPAGIRDRINLARRLPKKEVRTQTIAKMCLDQMQAHGKFVHARGGTLWYLLDQEGKPVPVNARSTQLNVLLDNMFALNATEPEHQYVVASLINHTANLPETGEIASLSHYMPTDNTLLLHTGSKDVVRITTDYIDIVKNGYKDIIFLWNSDQDITPNTEQPNTTDTDTWYDALFGPSLQNIASDGVSAECAMALLKSWFITLLMRNAIASRPILAIFGQPGAGKSTLFKRVYALLYGPHKAVSGVGTAQEFDYAMSVDPLLVLDNVDTWEKWLPDRIARAAGVSEITRRKLYTDVDTITLRLQAFLGITAHNPKFGREDVLDRFLMITLERIQHFSDETEMVQNVLSKRNLYWGQIARDVQRVLKEPEPHPRDIAQFRVQDFSKIGQRIANALGFGHTFHDAITTMVDQQKGFVLDEDSILVELIAQYIKSPRYKNEEFVTPAKLWGILDLLGGTDKNFGKQYGNSIKLGRKLWAMQDALKQRFHIEWRFDPIQKTRVWSFKERSTDDAETQQRHTSQP